MEAIGCPIWIIIIMRIRKCQLFFLADMDCRTIGFYQSMGRTLVKQRFFSMFLPAYRRQGVANQLLAAFAKVADKYDLTEIEYVGSWLFERST